MKKYLLMLGIAVILSSCYTVRTAGRSGKVPPGQAKKRAGSKSAKPFAPGQQKKNRAEKTQPFVFFNPI